MTRRWLWPLLIATVLIAAVLGIAVGTTTIPPARIAAALTGHGDPIDRAILLDLRLPRVLLGFLVGAMLGVGGAALQGYLRNPLAEPSVLGASNGAALGAVGVESSTVQAMGGHKQVHPLGASFFTQVPLRYVGIGEKLMEIATWLLGSLEDRSIRHVALALPCVAIGLLLLTGQSRALDALTLGEDGAAALGIDLRRVRWRLLLGVAIGVGGAVAVSGAIGFVGLIVPHLIRPLTDRRPSAVLWPSALAGGALLLLADLAVRLIPTSSELKLGVVTAFLGVPVFLVHLMRERRLW